MVKKEEKTKTKKTVKKVAKKKDSFFKGVKKELAKVKWPTAKEVLKYTIATVVFIIILVAFFAALNLLMSFVKGLFN